MLRNYFLIAVRNIRKHLGFSVINVFGLALGIATCLLLVTWVSDELSYDRFHRYENRLYRISLEYGFGGQVARTPVSPTALLPAMLTLPEVETGARFFNHSAWNPYIVRYNDRVFSESKFCFADSSFFDVFSYNLVSGNAHESLDEPYQVLLTESSARKYFGDSDPVGKLMQINNDRDYLVTGVIQDPPSNSYLRFDFIASFASLRAAREEPIWWSANYLTFVVLREGAEPKAVEEKTSDIAMKAVGKDVTGEGDYVRYNIILLRDLHLRSDFMNEPEVVGSITYVYIFAGIAALILLIASINYVNLTTARATERAREIGIRKVAGAMRHQLFYQFMAESACITFTAFFLAFGLAILGLPLFNQLAGKQFSSDVLLNWRFFSFSVAGIIVLSLLAGAYPAIAITRFKPVSVLKGNFRNSAHGLWLRRSLVVVQFSVSVVLIVGTLVILKQLDFLQQKQLGYDKENVIILPLDARTKENYSTLKTELLKSGAARYVCRGSSAPFHVQAGYSIAHAEQPEQGIALTGLVIDEDYIPAMGMALVQGQNFDEMDVTRIVQHLDEGFILNEAALVQLGIEPADAVGRKVVMNGRTGPIKGVVKNFHFSSLHHTISPLVMFIEPENLNKVLIRLSAGNVQEKLATVQRITQTLMPQRPFDYSFLDQEYGAMYAAEQRMSHLFVSFASLAIIIASLGLLGLVAYAAVQKTKEIGIRKVLGASASVIVLLLTKEFLKLVLTGIFIGIPLGAYMMTVWLNDFAYRTDIGILPAFLAGTISLLIALATAAFHALKAAFVNPAETLRSD
jgi:putative ABC transport system permease protein